MIKTRFLAFLTILSLLPLMSCEDLFFAEKIIKITIDPDYELDDLGWGDVWLAYYNEENGVDWTDRETFDWDYSRSIGEAEIDGEVVYWVAFKQYTDQYISSFWKPVTLALYELNLFDIDVSEEQIIARITVDNLKGEHYYEWNPAKNTFAELGPFEEFEYYEEEEDDDNSPSNPIVGRWNLVGGCSNLNGDTDYLVFNSGGTGRYFKADCNSVCPNYGFSAFFNYSTSGSNLVVDYTSITEYCNTEAPLPADQNTSFSISGNILTIDGVQFQRN